MKASGLVAVLACAPVLAQGHDPGWTQPRADPAGSASVDYATVTADPVVRWRLELGEPVADPVSWDRSAYVVYRAGRDRRLVAVDVISGEELCAARLGRGGEVHLAVFQGTVVVVDADGLRTYLHKDGRLNPGKRNRGEFTSAPCLVGPTALLTGPEGLTVIEVTRGRVVAELEMEILGRPAFHSQDGREGRLAGQRFHQGNLELLTLDVQDLGDRRPTFGEPRTVKLDRFGGGPLTTSGYAAFVGIHEQDEVWYLRSPNDPVTALISVGRYGSYRTSPFRSEPALFGASLCGMSKKGTFVTQAVDGTSDFFEGAKSAGGVSRGVTIADGVALLGNWAIELSGRRVLWRMPDLDPRGLMIPAAPGWIVTWSGQELLGIAGADEGIEQAGALEEAANVPALRPDSGPGLIDARGRFHPGQVEQVGTRWRITPDDGAPAELEGDEVAWALDDLRGDEYPLYLAWREALDAQACTALIPHFEAYARISLLADCRRLLGEMRARGYPAARARELEQDLIGMTQSTASNADRQRARVARGEDETRAALVEALLASSDWCKQRDAGTAATALLAHADRLLPGVEAVHGRAAHLFPPGFPWETEADATERWMRWADEMLPAGARFLPPDSAEWATVADTIWEQDTLGFETRNLLFLSKCQDEAIVGRCLRNGEGAVRVLDGLLSDSASEKGSVDRFSVRLHATRSEYIAEETPSGAGGSAFTLGYYVPREHVSRFFVPDADSSDPLGRMLHEVLAHELTHQYLSERWIGASDTTPGQPGYWIVEGFARFIDDQVTELGHRGARLDDPTVPSVETMVQLAKEDEWHPFEELIDWKQIDFARLSNIELMASVRLRNTLGLVQLSPLIMFYEQGGALVYYMMNARGTEGRVALIRYMKAYYEQGDTKLGWKVLGFESAEELEQAFRAFLRALEE